MIYDELPSSWRFVDDEKKLSKNTACESCSEESPIVLTHIDTLPSFIFRTTGNFFTPIFFNLTEIGGNIIDMSAEIPNMELFSIGNYTYVAYNIRTFISTPLATGIYQATISDGYKTFYSEPIRICDDITKCIKFNWTNSCDLAGIPYPYLQTAFGTPFLNTFQADLKLVNAEYETEKEKLENMLRQTENFYQSQTRNFSLKNKEGVPDWFARAIQVMQMHSAITVIYDIDNNHQNGLYATAVEECTVISSPSQDACTSSLEVKFRQDDAVISTLCCVNSSPEDCLAACYTVNGYAASGFPAVGQYQIMDFDSNIIKKYLGSGVYGPALPGCNYVLNSSTSTYMFYNGDLWLNTPDITSVSVVLIQGNFTTIALTGYTMPNTWVYVGSSALEGGCNYEPIAYSAADLAAGLIQIVVNTNTYYYVCIRSVNHNCVYDTRQIHFEL